MKTSSSSPSLTLARAFEQFLQVSSFARRTRESYTEDLAPLFAECGQIPVTGLTAEVIQTFLVRQESLAPATYNRRLAALRSFTRWLRDQGRLTDALLDSVERKPEGKRTARALDAQQVESVLRKIEDPRDRALFWLIYDGAFAVRKRWPLTSTTFPGPSARFSSTAKATAHARCSSRVPSAPSSISTWRRVGTRRRDRSS